MGSTVFGSRTYPYVECASCGSLFCEPMPDGDALAAMYGREYLETWYGDSAAQAPEHESGDRRRVAAWLGKLPPGVFLDYGCGRGDLLHMAQAQGWDALGLEFDPSVAEAISRRVGARVVTRLADLGTSPVVDVLHLGDVLEHLTCINEQFPEILRAIKPGGMLLAQGPLENNRTLFLEVLRMSRRIRRPGPGTIPPYHVSLSTVRGQRALFERFGIEEVDFSVSEVAWPAPKRITFRDVARPRAAALFALRKLSQGLSAVTAASWGNRFFFAGRLPSLPQSPSVMAGT